MNYKVSLLTSGMIYKQSGETVEEALSKLGLKWNQIKAKGVITVSKDGLSYEHLFYLKQLRRIFVNKVTLLLWAKRLTLLLKEGKKKNFEGDPVEVIKKENKTETETETETAAMDDDL